ncbi:hypothetical protein J6590_048292 [Homalodisca vitripennis]|nr:hypothetical protein J6590_048292 [Homalodisca vitripennis]
MREVSTMKEQIQDMQQYSRLQNLEISGVQCHQMKMCSQFCKLLQQQLILHGDAMVLQHTAWNLHEVVRPVQQT